MIGIVYALLSAALFGVSAPIAKMLLGEVSPWLLVATSNAWSVASRAALRTCAPSGPKAAYIQVSQSVPPIKGLVALPQSP